MSAQIGTPFFTGGTDLSAGAPIWVRAAFSGDDIGVMCVSISEDLRDWVVVSSGFAAGTGTLRDPQLLFHRGTWWAVFGNGAFGATDTFGIASSPDLRNWTDRGTIDCGDFIVPGGAIWQPILAHDANGKVYCIGTLQGGGAYYLMLRPTDEDDLTTLVPTGLATVSAAIVSAGGMGVIQSAFYHDGFYYAIGNTGSAHVCHKAAVPDGQYDIDVVLDTIGGDAIGVTVDNGDWYAFLDGPTGVEHAWVTAYQKSANGYADFGDVQVGTQSHFHLELYHRSKNPSARRHYGWGAVSARAASQYILASRPVGTERPMWSGTSLSYHISDASAAAGADLYPGNIPHVQSGSSVAGAVGSACLFPCALPMTDLFLSGAGLVGNLRPIEFKMELFHYQRQITRLIIGGVEDQVTGLVAVGIALKFTTGADVTLQIHDGTTLHEYASTYTYGPNGGTTAEIRVVAWASLVIVWINGFEVFRRYDVPVAVSDTNHRAVLLQTEYTGTGSNNEAWVIGASVRLLY